MAQEHTLKLKAVLDTSDIQAKLNRLNGQQSQAQLAGPSKGAPGGIAQDINNVLLRLNNTLTQLNQSITRMNQGISRTTNANVRYTQPHTVSQGQIPGIPVASNKTIDTFRPQGLVTDRVYEEALRRAVKKAIANNDSAGWLGQYSGDDYHKGIFGGTLGTGGENQAFQRIFGGTTWKMLNNPKFKPYIDDFLNPPDPKKEKFSKLYMRTMKMMMSGQVVGQFASLGQQHAELTGHDDIAKGLGALQNVAQMAAFGSVLGPYGMAGGAAIGGLQSAYEIYLNNKKQEEQARLDEKAAADVKRKYRSAREAFGMDRSIYAATRNEDVSLLEQIRQSLAVKQQNTEDDLSDLDAMKKIDPTVATELQTTLASVISKIQTIDQTIEAIKKHKEEEARLSEKINKGISDSRLAMSRYDEARLNGRFFSESVDDYRQNAELYGSTARANKAEYLRLLGLAESETDNEKKQKILQEAADVKSAWQFNLGQSDSFQQGYISKLQEILSRLVAPDMSPVTSLAAIGRDAGASDNMYRQQRFWDETLNLQREIRDAIDKGVATYD